MKILRVDSPGDRRQLPHVASLPPFDANRIPSDAADAHLCALTPKGEIVAHASLWWNATPLHESRHVGAIGHFSSADSTASTPLLEASIAILREQGCTLAVGPMDGNTWRKYRFVTEAGSEPPFFLEPTNPPQLPGQFELAGFTPLAEYFSALNTDLTQTDPRMQRVAERLEHTGIRLRSAELVDMPAELARIYRLSAIAFAKNFLYTELPEQAFLSQYTPILPHIRPELVVLAERGSELVGYSFAIPDLAQAQRGHAIDTFILKTIAILPQTALAGLGGLLVARTQEIGHQLGFRRCIHALMHQGNRSRNISGHYAQTMRKYTLYSREIPA